MSQKNLKEIGRSPDGRYLKFDKKIGTGAYKSVYLGYDTEKGIEVAWNIVTLERLPDKERKRIAKETKILQTLTHPNIIEFYDVWEDKEEDQIIFTTEIVSSGSLKEYANRSKDRTKLKIIKKWCIQILDALHYLHTRNPPIIHRDLKCDNIFINGGTGDLRIGDLGLSTQRFGTNITTVLGTPEFMAPELYDEHYNEMVDIYAFGMCVLELSTNEYPYQECLNPAQIYKKVIAGYKPDILERILDIKTKSFIKLCLCQENSRLNSQELLDHPFLKYESIYVNDRYPVTMDNDDKDTEELENIKKSRSDKYETIPPTDESSVNKLVGDPQIILQKIENNIANIALKLPYDDGRRRIVKFQFNFVKDTAFTVSKEMCAELKLLEVDRKRIQLNLEKYVEAFKNKTLEGNNLICKNSRKEESGMNKQTSMNKKNVVEMLKLSEKESNKIKKMISEEMDKSISTYYTLYKFLNKKSYQNQSSSQVSSNPELNVLKEDILNEFFYSLIKKSILKTDQLHSDFNFSKKNFLKNINQLNNKELYNNISDIIKNSNKNKKNLNVYKRKKDIRFSTRTTLAMKEGMLHSSNKIKNESQKLNTKKNKKITQNTKNIDEAAAAQAEQKLMSSFNLDFKTTGLKNYIKKGQMPQKNNK